MYSKKEQRRWKNLGKENGGKSSTSRSMPLKKQSLCMKTLTNMVTVASNTSSPRAISVIALPTLSSVLTKWPIAWFQTTANKMHPPITTLSKHWFLIAITKSKSKQSLQTLITLRSLSNRSKSTYKSTKRILVQLLNKSSSAIKYWKVFERIWRRVRLFMLRGSMLISSNLSNRRDFKLNRWEWCPVRILSRSSASWGKRFYRSAWMRSLWRNAENRSSLSSALWNAVDTHLMTNWCKIKIPKKSYIHLKTFWTLSHAK